MYYYMMKDYFLEKRKRQPYVFMTPHDIMLVKNRGYIFYNSLFLLLSCFYTFFSLYSVRYLSFDALTKIQCAIFFSEINNWIFFFSKLLLSSFQGFKHNYEGIILLRSLEICYNYGSTTLGFWSNIGTRIMNHDLIITIWHKCWRKLRQSKINLESTY